MSVKPAEDKSPSLHDIATNKDLVNKKEKQEWGGPKGLEPTRYGDWEVNGRVSDF